MNRAAERPAPRLSLVIPVRDRPAALARLSGELAREVRSVGDRAGLVECVLVDDASTPPALFPAPPGLARAAHLRLPRRRGANGARAAGLSRAEGDWVHLHDSDDGFEPGWLDAVLAGIDAAEREGASVLLTRRIDEIDGRRETRAQLYAERQRARPDRIARMLRARNCLGPFGGLCFARAALSGIAFPDIPSCQDWAVYLALWRLRAPRLAIAPGARFLYRRDGTDRISASHRRKALGYAAMRRRAGGRGEGPGAACIRLHLLHLARPHLAALDRPALDAILRRTRAARLLAHGAVLVWKVLALRWR